MTQTMKNIMAKQIGSKKSAVHKRLSFDLPVQRDFVWAQEQSSLLIHSLIEEFYVPPIVIFENETGDILPVGDGKQRCLSLVRFYNEDYKLSANTPSLADGREIAGLKYSKLPEDVREKLDSANIICVHLKGMTEDQKEEQFQRLQAGSPLVKMEKARAMAGETVTGLMDKLTNMDFFAKRATLSATNRKRKGDTGLVLQCLSLFTMRNASFAENDTTKFLVSMKESPLSEDAVTAFEEAVTYLELVFPEVVEDGKVYVYEYLKKTAIPLLVKLAEVALENGIDESDFFDFVESFFAGKTKYGISYKSRAASGTSTKKNVMARFGLMLDGFKEHMAELGQKDLVIPQNCDFSVWAQQEAEAKAIAEALKLQRKADAQAKREETKRKKAERELAKAQAKADATTVNSDTDEVDDTDEEELDINGTSVEDDVLEETVLDAIVKASNGNKVGQAEFDKIKESLVGELFGAQA